MKAAAALVLGIVWGLATPVRAEAPPRNLEELRARISGVLLREHVPGVGIALVEGDQVLWAGGVGVSDRGCGRAVSAYTLFRVGSITKSFIGLAFVRLAERGRVDLRARVSDLAPELTIGNRWADDQPITVAHLLEHTAGFDDMHPNEMYAPLADVLARNPASRVARWRPGAKMSYANPGYTVAAYLLEKITGRPYEDVLERELLEPLGMTGAALRLTPEVDARLSRGYHEAEEAIPYRAIYHRPAGNLMASPRELAALVVLGLARGRYGGRTLVSPSGWARFERGETARLDPGDSSYGLGVYGDVSERALIRGHNGAIDGFLSAYGYLPEHNVGFVMLLNSTRSGPAFQAIRHLIVEFLLSGAHVRPPPRAVVSEEELRRWAGNYHSASPRHQLFAFLERVFPGIELFVDGGRLYARDVPSRGRTIELIPVGGDRFRLPDTCGSLLAFGRDAEGRRIFGGSQPYFVEEPRAQSVAYCIVPIICVWILGTGLLFPLSRFRRQVGPSPSIAWPMATAFSFFMTPRLFFATLEHNRWGTCNFYSVAIFVLTLVFAIGSTACAVQALRWLPRPGSIAGKLHRLVFAAAACLTTAYLAGYDIIGLRLWSY
jgi:CubicO group peptidase (beta-lactamase class C family)